MCWRKLLRSLQFPFLLPQRIGHAFERLCRLETAFAHLAKQTQAQHEWVMHQQGVFETGISHLTTQTQAQHEWVMHQQAALSENSRLFQERVDSALREKVSEYQLAKQLDHVSRTLLTILHHEISKHADLATFSVHAQAGKTEETRVVDDVRVVDFYQTLETCFRGNPDDIKERLRIYLEYIPAEKRRDGLTVLDIGSGRGEWLELLAAEGIAARGVDLNPINGDVCRNRGLNVTTGDALEFLAALPDASCTVVTAFHLVEHLPFPVLMTLTDQAMRVLEPGGILIFETPNPENLLVATRSFWIDPTHIRLLPPPLLEFLLAQRGFVTPEILRLHPDDACSGTQDPVLQALIAGPRDYAVVARKPVEGTLAP